LQSFDIGRHGQHNLPARVFDPAQQRAGLVAKPPCRAHHTEVAPQTGFYPTGTRLFDHDDERWFHVK